MAKKNSLTSALSASLGNSSSAPKKKTTAGKVPPKASGQGAKPRSKGKAVEKVVEEPKKAKPVEKAKSKSISFYQSEFDKMSKVRQILTPHVDSAVNNTQVVRLALELLELNEKKLVKAYLDLRERDGKPN